MALGKQINFPKCLSVMTLGKAVVTVNFPFPFFSPRVDETLGKIFAECPIENTRQTRLCRVFGCRVVYAVGGTQQRLCRVYLGLCRVSVTLDKAEESGSESESSVLIPYNISL